MVYNALFLNYIQPNIKKIIWKRSEWFSEKSIHNFLNSDYLLNHQSMYKKCWGNTFISRFFPKHLTPYTEKMEQTLLKTVITVMMLYKVIKAIACSFSGDTDPFGIVAGIL